jgi:hypothetical protein
MGNTDFSEEFRYLDFLKHNHAPALFNDLYDTLRNGVHIQKQSHPKFFNFIESGNNQESLKEFIKLFNKTQMLTARGQQNEKYYFIDFLEDSKGNTKLRPIDDDYTLVGFLIYKFYFMESVNFDFSISNFQDTIMNHEFYKKGVIKNFGKTSRDENGTTTDKVIKDTIRKAFNFFDKIGWIKIDSDGDGFIFYPAFQRIIDFYAKDIDTIDTWLNE